MSSAPSQAEKRQSSARGNGREWDRMLCKTATCTCLRMVGRRIRLQTSIIVMVGVVHAGLALPCRAGAEVVFEPLQELGHVGHARSINEVGQAAGFSGAPRLAVRWEPDGTLSILGTLDGDPDSQASDINDLGDAAGISFHEPFSNGDPVIWFADGNTENIGIPPGQTSADVNGINNLGSVILVGWITGSGMFDAYYRPAGGPTMRIGSLGGMDTRAQDINDSNIVVGYSKDPSGKRRAYRWEPGGSMVDLGTLPGEVESLALEINELGEIVGSSGSRAVVWDIEGDIKALQGLGPGTCWARGINDLGFVVGICGWRAVIWTPEGEVIDLNDYLPASADVTLVAAFDVNDSFQIVGTMVSGVGFPHRKPFRLTIPKPGAVSFRVDIRPGSCPNMVNPRSRGVVPVAIVGSLDFDVAAIDPDSLTLARVDGVGTSVAPLSGRGGRGIVIKDVATPLVGEPCTCHDVDRDGIDDLAMKFSTLEMSRAFELNGLPRGTSIELMLQGSLQDGTTFEGVDCIVVPGTERNSIRRHHVRRP